MVVGLEFFLREVNQEPSNDGINPSIGTINYVGHLTGTVISNDANNNGSDAYSFRGYVKEWKVSIKKWLDVASWISWRVYGASCKA